MEMVGIVIILLSVSLILYKLAEQQKTIEKI